MKQLGTTYEVGDMVWAKIKSHPWWPRQVFLEAFAMPCVSKTKKQGHLLVAFFGDNSYGWFDRMELIPFDVNYVEKSMQTDARPFLDAVEEAEDEAGRRAALGVSCQCHNPCNFRATGVKRFVEVDMNGHQLGVVYSKQQIKNAREGFQPFEMLCFVHKLASMPSSDLKRSIDWIKNIAVVLAYRKAVFEDVDKTYAQALGEQPIHGAKSFQALNLQEQGHSQDPFRKEATTVKKSTLENNSIKATVDGEPKRVKYCDRSQGFQQCRPKFKKLVETSHSLENVQVVGRVLPPPDAVVIRKVTSSEGLDEKPRVQERFGGDLHSEETLLAGKNKRKKEFKSEPDLECSDNLLKDEKRESGYKPHTFSSDSMATEQMVGLRSINSNFPQLLSYLLDLAHSPCHCKNNIPEIVPKFFMKLRSVVFKKDFVVAPAAEAELTESSPTKSSACCVAKSPYNVTAQDLPCALKPPKKGLKPDDYANVGVNSSICDHVKKMPVEELKKMKELKLLTAEKQTDSWKLLKPKGSNERKMNVVVPKKLTTHTPRNMQETSTRAAEPTMIGMQFPHQSALPSVSELKARFARFGQLHSAPHVFWKFSTCQVIFKFKSNAQAAYEYAVKNRSLFGSAKVEYYLQAFQVPATEFPKPGKQLVIGKSPDWVPPVMSMSMGNSTKPRSTPPQLPNVQSKSFLKKQQVDEVIIIHSDTPHVKNMMKGEESIGTEQLANRNVKISVGNHSNDTSDAYATVNINPQNLHEVMPPLPLPPNRISCMLENHKLDHFVEICNRRYLQLEARNKCIYTPSSERSINISNQTLNLLMRCHDIVANLKCSLGYVPFNL
ncbi:uncharacterized protein LOC116132774 [Pistacia vera]|uniref:uncharacterized protein LOC116132774 n=1 Tax=Pistacia vera TaxID=55513 RepID=UPI001263698A|nr:uncharacterized protein LOC116132774 [Pistacia vera]